MLACNLNLVVYHEMDGSVANLEGHAIVNLDNTMWVIVERLAAAIPDFHKVGLLRIPAGDLQELGGRYLGDGNRQRFSADADQKTKILALFF